MPSQLESRLVSSNSEQMSFRCSRHPVLCSALVSLFVFDVAASVALWTRGLAVNAVLCLTRAIVLLGGVFLAVNLGKGKWTCKPRAHASGQSRLEADSTLAEEGDIGTSRALEQPLALRRNGDAEAGCLELSTSSFIGGKSMSEVRELRASKERHDAKRNIILGMCFAFVVAQSIYTGIEVLAIGQTDALAAVLITCVIVCANLEFVLLKKVAALATEEIGELVSRLHEHPLYFRSNVQMAQCQVCGQRIGQNTGGYDRLECKLCRDEGGKGKGKGMGAQGFAVCVSCYRSQQAKANTEDGILRGDKGPKVMVNLTPWQYFLRAIRLTKRFRGTFAIAVVSVVATQAAKVTLPNYTGKIINALVAGEQRSFQEYLLTFILLTVGSAIFSCAQGLGVEVVARRLTLDIRREMFQSLIKQDIAFFDGTMIGQLTSRMTNDVTQVLAPVRQLLNTVLANVLLLTGGLFMCFLISWKLTVLASTMIGPVMYLTTLYAQFSRNMNLKVMTSIADANAVATEALRNIRTVRSFAAEHIEVASFQCHLLMALDNGMKDAFASAAVNAINTILDNSATALVLGYGGLSVLKGGEAELTVGQLITFNMYWTMVNQAIKGLNSMLSSLVRAASSAQRVFEIIDLEPDIPLQGGMSPPANKEPCTLEFCDVHFTYQMRPDHKVIRGLNFSIQPGQTVAIVGRSGAGKTTLINLLLRLYDPQEGEVLLNGHPLSEYDATKYRRLLGVVSQDTQMFCRSIRDNLSYGLNSTEVTDELVIEASCMANAHDFVSKLDGGYYGMVGEGGLRLSGGQRQRLAIARSLLRRPSLLLLDEATSSLDAENEGQVQAAVDRMMSSMARRCSVVLIAHRLSTVMNADKIIVLNDGQLAEEGTHGELLGSGKIYAQLVRRQLARQANSLSEDAETSCDDALWTRDCPEVTGKGKGNAKSLVPCPIEHAAPADSVDHLFDEVNSTLISLRDRWHTQDQSQFPTDVAFSGCKGKRTGAGGKDRWRMEDQWNDVKGKFKGKGQ